MANESRRISIEIESGKFSYMFGSQVIAAFDIDSLVIVAEHTNDRGPIEDDYFVVFVGGRPVMSIEVPVHIGLRALRRLSEYFGVELNPALSGSTDFKSRIIWPTNLSGRPYFDYVSAPRSTIVGRLIDRVLPRNSWQMTDEVVARIRATDATDDLDGSANATSKAT